MTDERLPKDEFHRLMKPSIDARVLIRETARMHKEFEQGMFEEAPTDLTVQEVSDLLGYNVRTVK